MANTFSLTGVEGELVATMGPADLRPAGEVPFRLLLIGDWSGRANRALFASSEELKAWRPLPVDRDNLDQLIARLGVKLNLPLASDGSDQVTVTCNSLDDFHPDRLLLRLEVFESLLNLRAKLSHPKTFAAAATEIRGWSTLAAITTLPPVPPAISAEPPGAGSGVAGNLLDQILAGGTASSAAKLSQPTAEVSREISEFAGAVVKPYLTPDIGADQDELIAALDARMTGDMNALLHHPDFQAIESAWRALDFLVSRIETGTDLELFLLDISFDEFKADLRSNDDVRATALYKLLVEQTVGTPGGDPWAVIAGNFTFDFTAPDAGLVERISTIASLAGAPFIAGTTAHLLGCESLVKTPDPDDWCWPVAAEIEDGWKNLTSLDSAAYFGLALPRFLLRLPYGRDTNPTEEFDFAELGDFAGRSPRHESYLWANPAFAVAFLLAKGFSEYGWDLRPSDSLEIEGLPLHVYERDGNSEIKPSAEVLLTVRAAGRIIDRGLMPLLSMKDSDTIRLGMFQSIRGASIRGRWSH